VRDPPSRNRDTRAALAYHEATAHSERSVRSSTHVLDWPNRPLPFKILRELEPVQLPGFHARDIPALAAIAGSAPLRSGPPDLATLARVLYLAAGITKRKRHSGGEILLRAYPNTGALHHVDLYVVAGELPGLAAGVYHFAPDDFALRRLRAGDYRALLVEASGGCPELARAALVIASASTWWRNAWKYQSRAWRHMFWDGGTLHANLLAAAASDGLEPSVVMGYADAALDRLLGLDPQREGGVALVPLGRSAVPPPAAPVPGELRLAALPLSRSEVDYPWIRDAQAASALRDGDEAAAWRAAATAEAAAPDRPLLPLTPLDEAALPRESLDSVILRRGSTRVFDRVRSLRFEELCTALDRATRGVPADFLGPPPATLLDLYLIVNAVEGLAPGAYLYHRAGRALELLREGRFRSVAGHLALGQDLAADAAVNVYSLADLARVLERFGNRGYRAAQLEGGITGGRLYLAAYALSFGATGLTFFDDEVTDFFSPHASGKSVMFLTALGHPDRVALGLAR
jgi:SagB-type dehydrogenase family enzyme